MARLDQGPFIGISKSYAYLYVPITHRRALVKWVLS